MHVAILSWSVKFCGRACYNTSRCCRVGSENMKENLHLGRIFRFSSYFCKFKGQNFSWKYFVMLFQECNSYIDSFSINIFHEEKKIKEKFALFIYMIMIHFQCTFDSFYYSLSINLLQLCVHFLMKHCLFCRDISVSSSFLTQFYCEILSSGLPWAQQQSLCEWSITHNIGRQDICKSKAVDWLAMDAKRLD